MGVVSGLVGPQDFLVSPVPLLGLNLDWGLGLDNFHISIVDAYLSVSLFHQQILSANFPRFNESLHFQHNTSFLQSLDQLDHVSD